MRIGRTIGRRRVPRIARGARPAQRTARAGAAPRALFVTAILLCALAALLPQPAFAGDAVRETWPELQLKLGLPQQTELMLTANSTQDRDLDVRTQRQVGFTLTHRLTDWFSLGIGYRYSWAPGSDPFTENRPLGEQTFRFRLPWDVLLALRTREDLRWLDTGFSVRVRERLKLDRPVQVGTYTFTPYASAELYWDSRFDALVTRGRWTVGSVFPIVEHLEFEIYLARQVDWQPRTKKTNALGLVLTASF